MAWTKICDQLNLQKIVCFCEFNSRLYAGTTPNGRLFRLNLAGDAWEQVCDTLNAQQSIWGMGVFNNRLYAGTGLGGRLFRLNLAGDAWEQVCDTLNGQQNITSNLIVYNNRLYGGTYITGTGNGGQLFRLNLAGDAWEQVCSQLNSQIGIYSLCEFEGRLYGGTFMGSIGGRLFRLNLAGDAWEQVCGQLNSQVYVFSLCVFNSRLYGSTNPGGRLFRLNLAKDAWEQVCNEFIGQVSVYSIAGLNGRLYGGTGFGGRLFRLNLAGDAWEEVCVQYGSENVIRDIRVFNNALYGAGYNTGLLLKADIYFTLIYTAGLGGTITGISPQFIESGGDGTEVTAVPDPGYAFSSWSDGVLTAARTDLNVTDDKTVTANFIVATFTLTYTAGSGGTIIGTNPQTIILGNDGTEVTAVPDPGYAFSSWSDGVLTAARTDLNVTDDKTVTANFIVATFTLTYTAGSGGTIIGTNPQTIILGNDGTEVIAEPNYGYKFLSWSDGVLTAARTDLNVIANVSVTANFQELDNMAYFAGQYLLHIKPVLLDWLTNSGTGKKVTDLALSLANRAQDNLWAKKPWSNLAVRLAPTLVNNAYTLPANFGRIIDIWADLTGQGNPSYWYFEGDRQECGYRIDGGFDIDTGPVRVITFNYSQNGTVYIRYQKILEDFTGGAREVEYSFFPTNLLILEAQKINCLEKGAVKEWQALSAMHEEVFKDYCNTAQWVNPDTTPRMNDRYGNEIMSSSYSLNGEGTRPYSENPEGFIL